MKPDRLARSAAIARDVAIIALEIARAAQHVGALARERGGPDFDAVVTKSLKQQIELVRALADVGLRMPAMVVLARIAADGVSRGALTRDKAVTLVNQVQRVPSENIRAGFERRRQGGRHLPPRKSGRHNPATG